ncbi:hypothetical protein CapIbe_017952 [Capra ibex]
MGVRGTLSTPDNSRDESLVTGGGSRPLRRNFHLSPHPSPGQIVTRTLGSNARPGTSPPVPPSLRLGRRCSPLPHAPPASRARGRRGGRGRTASLGSLPLRWGLPGPDGRPGGDRLRPEKETEGCP